MSWVPGCVCAWGGGGGGCRGRGYKRLVHKMGFTTYRNGPKRTGTDRNGLLWIPKRTFWVPKRTLVDTETDRDGQEWTETDRNGPKRTFVDTETDFLGTETDFSRYQNTL